MRRSAMAVMVVVLLIPTAIWAQPPEPPIWNEQLRAELPKGMNATRYKEWIRLIYEAGTNLINLNGYKYGMVEGEKIPVNVFQCVMGRLGHGYAVKMKWDGIAKMAKEHMARWKCDDDTPGGPGVIASALIDMAAADFINSFGYKAKVEFQAPPAERLKEVSGKAATFTAVVGTGAAILFVLATLVTG